MTSTPKTPDEGVPDDSDIEAADSDTGAPEADGTEESRPPTDQAPSEPADSTDSGPVEPVEPDLDDADSAEAEVIEPGPAELGPAEPGSVGPDSAEPEPAESDAAEPDAAEPALGEETTAPERHGGHVVLGGCYELGDVLGTGATFTVYEARPSDAGDDGDWSLVVKVLHPHLVDDEYSRAALQREVSASELVDHPGVVKVLATGEDDVAGAVVPWTVMHRFPGTLLSDTAAGGGLPWQDALEIVADVLDGLAAVHAAGLVHHDIAPRNVMVERHDDGTYGVGLLDLGLTAPGGGEGDGETVSGSIIGMSPEQAKGQPLDARSDLYSVGALTYYAITGHAPFERAAAQDVLRAHVEAPVPAVSARKPMVPGQVDRIVARAMAKNPLRRYPNATEMAATVRGLLDGPGGRATAVIAPAGSVPDPAQRGSDPTEKFDQVGGGTLRVGRLSDDAGGEARTTVVGAYVPGDDPASTEVLTPPVPGPPAGHLPPVPGPPTGRMQAVPKSHPVGPPSGPVPVGVPAEQRPARRGRVVALVVAVVLVLGGGGVALTSLLNSDWARPSLGGQVARELFKQPKPSPTSSDPVVAPEEEVVLPPAPESETSAPPSPTPSQTPSISPVDPTEEPTGEPSSGPTDPADEPTGEPTDPSGGGTTAPDDDAGDGDTGDGSGSGGGDSGSGSGGSGGEGGDAGGILDRVG